MGTSKSNNRKGEVTRIYMECHVKHGFSFLLVDIYIRIKPIAFNCLVWLTFDDPIGRSFSIFSTVKHQGIRPILLIFICFARDYLYNMNMNMSKLEYLSLDRFF